MRNEVINKDMQRGGGGFAPGAKYKDADHPAAKATTEAGYVPIVDTPPATDAKTGEETPPAEAGKAE